MVSHKHKCIFVHIPKSGGSSIENLVWPAQKDRVESNLCMGFISEYQNKYQTGGLQHLLSSQIKQELGEDIFNRYFKFTIVRNPWDKAVSQFTYMKKRKDLRAFIGLAEDDSFKKYLSLIQQSVHVQWESQHKFIMDENNKLMVDFLGRFESFERDTHKILDELKIGKTMLGLRFKKIPHTNKSLRSHYKDYYDAESKKIVEKIYNEDIERFEYTY